jgi:hypothetical protein
VLASLVKETGTVPEELRQRVSEPKTGAEQGHNENGRHKWAMAVGGLTEAEGWVKGMKTEAEDRVKRIGSGEMDDDRWPGAG